MTATTRGDKRRRKKQWWFDLGVEAAERVLGEPVPGYICPLCIFAFSSLDDLTFEHAPPESLGGREICLTCSECNSTAGHTVDAELRKAQHEREWRRGVGKPLRARFEVAGIALRVDVERTPEMVTLHPLPKQNNPADAVAYNEALRQALDEGEATVRFHFAGFDDRHAQVALLRSAYLIAFAALGCRYALRPELNLVRRQIANPAELILDRFVVHRRDSHAGRGIAWVDRPRPLESIVVKIDDDLVFLPGLKRGPTIYERLAKRNSGRHDGTSSGEARLSPPRTSIGRRGPSTSSTSRAIRVCPRMQVFISWSGEKSRKVALTLRQWLPSVIQALDPWVSAKDIDAGSRWQAEIAEKLDSTNFGIVCVTRDNQLEPWLNFEAGALAKSVEQGRLVPLAIDLKPSDVKNPLGQFQAQHADENGMREVMKSLNSACTALTPERLEKAFELNWPSLAEALAEIAEDDAGEPEAIRSERELLEETLDTVRSLGRLITTRLGPGPRRLPPNHPAIRRTTALLEANGVTAEVRQSAAGALMIRTDVPVPAELQAEVTTFVRRWRLPVRFTPFRPLVEAVGPVPETPDIDEPSD